MSKRPIQTSKDRRRNRAVRIAIAAIACIPLIYGGALVWANQDPTHRLDRIPAAVVDLDQPVTQNGQTVDVGKSLAHELVTSTAGNDFDWTQTSAASARAGLKDGSYLATITLPKDLSANAVSLGADKPLDAAASHIMIATDDGQNYIVGVASKTIGLAISQSASKSVSQQYLSQIYDGLNQVSTQLGTAASGAQKLAAGASTLSSGLGTLSSGAKSLASGTAQLSTGASALASGTSQLATGGDSLSSGLSTLSSQSAALPSSASRLASGATQLQQAVAGNGTASSPGYAGGVDQLADSCGSAQVKLAATADPVVAQLCAGINQVAGTQPDGTHANSDALRSGAQSLAAGTSALSQQAPALANGIAQASSGATQLDGKLRDAATGAANLATGAQHAASGASRLETGAAQADSGAQQLVTGSGQLASKLAEGSKSAPSYTSAERSHLSSVAAQPIALAQTALHSVPSYGYGLAPYFMALGTWVGGLSIYMILRAIPHRAIEAGRPGWRAALIGYLRGAWIALVQAALLFLVVTVGVGVHPAHPVGLALFLGAAALAFTAVNHTLMVLFGSRGRFLGLILLVLQVAAAGATYPIQTTPAFFQAMHGVLPMTYASNAIRSLIAGGTAGIGIGVLVMTCWFVGALVVSVAVTAFRQARRSEILLPDFAI